MDSSFLRASAGGWYMPLQNPRDSAGKFVYDYKKTHMKLDCAHVQYL